MLLIRGSAGPPYYEQINDALAAALPRARTLAVRCGHDGINRAPAQLIEPLAAFFETPARPCLTRPGGDDDPLRD